MSNSYSNLIGLMHNVIEVSYIYWKLHRAQEAGQLARILEYFLEQSVHRRQQHLSAG